MVPPIVGYPCPLRTRPVKHTVSGSCRPRERALILTLVNSVGILDLLTRTGTAVLPSSLSPAVAWLVERLGVRSSGSTTDTTENRVVKAFIGQSKTIIGRMRSAVGSSQPNAFRRNVLRDCDRMEASLMPIARHSMWEEVGRMVRIPFSSTVLQRRRGYRRVLQHFSRIRLAPIIPLDNEAMRDLLELKDIVTLYELWTFFRIVRELTVLKGPPVRSGCGAVPSVSLCMGFWCAPGVQPALLQVAGETKTFVLGAAASRYRSFGPRWPNAGLHLFDAKFRVHGLAEVGLTGSDKDGDDDKAGERASTFKRGDIYKMHAYRDAIPDARSVWILYPGGEFRFFGVVGSGGTVWQPGGFCARGVARRAAGCRRDSACSGCWGRDGP